MEFLELSKSRYGSPDQIGLIHVSLGERDQAMIWMEKAYEARSAFLASESGLGK